VVSVSKAAFVLKKRSVGEQLAETFTNKDRMKDFFVRRGILTPQFCTIRQPNDVISFANRVGFPIILKPCDNAGSRGVIRIDSSGEVEDGFSMVTTKTKRECILAEKFVAGTEYGCETFVRGGQRLVMLTRKIRSRPPYCAIGGHVAGIKCDRIDGFVNRVLDVMDIEGPVNMDIIDGDDGPMLLECGLRLGGNMLPQLVYLTQGVDTYREAIRLAVNVEGDIGKRIDRIAVSVVVKKSDISHYDEFIRKASDMSRGDAFFEYVEGVRRDVVADRMNEVVSLLFTSPTYDEAVDHVRRLGIADIENI